ncbi:sigma-70 region 4 domain-containing protein [Nocardia otitidiscaviarum]|uniref:sigma-70 region 4 domain-containing protein n=1 Tax=Nocardia otitidiscaviarum TaxID=1823 RepID=UPI001895EF5B|nr:sigma-70 region 4 domain-containing protein [Nocardia otitidiscaviarum]MBF6133490.1 sigma-70 region 4 domain-containing protein [Nocardia otitidiscaviarum]
MTSEPPEGISRDEAHSYVVALLDAVRKAEQVCALNKLRYMRLAQRYDMPAAEIAEYLGMSESGVRHALTRADASPGEGDRDLE